MASDDPWSDIPDDPPRQELIRDSSVNRALRPADPDMAGMLRQIQKVQADIAEGRAQDEKQRLAEHHLFRKTIKVSIVASTATVAATEAIQWLSSLIVYLWNIPAIKHVTSWMR